MQMDLNEVIERGNRAKRALDFLEEINNKIKEEISSELENEKPNFERLHLNAYACKFLLDEAKIAITRKNEIIKRFKNE